MNDEQQQPSLSLVDDSDVIPDEDESAHHEDTTLVEDESRLENEINGDEMDHISPRRDDQLPQPISSPSINHNDDNFQHHEEEEEQVYSDEDNIVDDDFDTEEGIQVTLRKKKKRNVQKVTSETNTEGEYIIHPRPPNFNNAPKPAYQIQLEIYYGEDFPNKTVLINVYNEQYQKPFLGGFKNTVNNLLYHHATTQTESLEQQQRQLRNVELNHRETQTKKFSSRGQQTLREQGTQMEKPGLTLDTSGDRVIQPSTNYFDYEMLRTLQIDMAIKIQKTVRGWIAKRRVNKIREQQQADFQKSILKAQHQDEMEFSSKQKEIKRRMHPRKAQDFAIMYEELEAWRIKETEAINEATSVNSIERKHAMKELLRKQTKLLQTIDRLKIVANQQNKQEAIQKDLDKMAQPKTIEYTNTTRVNYNRARELKEGAANSTANYGDDEQQPVNESNKRTTTIETPFTVRAKELRDLYYGLNTEMLSVDERLDVLLHVKWTVKEFEQDSLSVDIIQLIDREADLLNRGRRDSSLSGLRTRLSNLFLQFIKTPKYNPEAIAIENRKKNKMRDLIEGQ